MSTIPGSPRFDRRFLPVLLALVIGLIAHLSGLVVIAVGAIVVLLLLGRRGRHLDPAAVLAPVSIGTGPSAVGVPLARLGAKERKAVERLLADGERVVGAWRAGASFGALVCTENRALVAKTGRSDSNLRVSSYRYADISSVSVKWGKWSPLDSVVTTVTLVVPGLVINPGKDPDLRAENVITFGWTNGQKRAAQEAVAVLQARVDESRGTGIVVKTCPDCAENVQEAARVCRYCGYRFDAAPS